jgi:hypothetical protein
LGWTKSAAVVVNASIPFFPFPFPLVPAANRSSSDSPDAQREASPKRNRTPPLCGVCTLTQTRTMPATESRDTPAFAPVANSRTKPSATATPTGRRRYVRDSNAIWDGFFSKKDFLESVEEGDRDGAAGAPRSIDGRLRRLLHL